MIIFVMEHVILYLMNLQQLEYITALNKYRHFGRAAESCNVSQPTLSTMVQKLEEELGVKLFERSRVSVLPTNVGIRIIEQAERILHQTSLLSEIVHNESSSIGGTLNISVIPTIAPYLIPLIAPILANKLPDLKVNFHEYVTSKSIAALREHTIDMAIVAENEDTRKFKLTPLYFEEFYAYISRYEPLFSEKNIRSSQVHPDRLWLLDEGHCFRDQLLRFCQLKKESNPLHTYREGSLQTFMHMVEQGNGITFIPELALQYITSEQNKELVRTFAIPRPCRAVSLCTLDDYARTTLIKVVAELIQSVIPSTMLRMKATQQLV